MEYLTNIRIYQKTKDSYIALSEVLDSVGLQEMKREGPTAELKTLILLVLVSVEGI